MKMQFIPLLFLVLWVASIQVEGQMLITKKDTISLENDTIVKLVLPEYRGNIQWQQSFDKINWNTSTNRVIDSLAIQLSFSAYYRAKILEGGCNPIYSDTMKIVIADSIRTVSADSIFEVAYPDSVGESTQFVVNNDTLNCKKIKNEYIFQGDIILTEEQLQIESELKGAGIPLSTGFNLWPENTVYYTIDEKLKDDSRITDAISHWDKNTTIRFKERTDEFCYVKFVWDAEGCSSNLGMIIKGFPYIDPPQLIRIADWGVTGNVIHEIGHTIGLLHEQSRSDRESFVSIIWDNIQNEYSVQFGIWKNSTNSSNFDFNSVMLYPSYNGFAIDMKKPTMINKSTGLPFDAQRSKLSSADKEIVKKLYPPLKSKVTTNNIVSITQTTAKGGGNVTSDGGLAVTARGVCWNTTGNPTIENDKTEDGSGTGTFTSSITGLTPNTPYYVRAYATNSQETAYGNEVSFTTLSESTLEIGQNYQGGIIFYIDNTGQHGLIAASNDQSTGIKWYNGTYIVTGASGTVVGTGQGNTTSIISALGSGNYAASLCTQLVLNEYDDWFLPSKEELNLMFRIYSQLGLSEFADYWSSTESGGSGYGAGAWYRSKSFNSNGNEYYSARVRAIRAF